MRARPAVMMKASRIPAPAMPASDLAVSGAALQSTWSVKFDMSVFVSVSVTVVVSC